VDFINKNKLQPVKHEVKPFAGAPGIPEKAIKSSTQPAVSVSSGAKFEDIPLSKERQTRAQELVSAKVNFML